MTDDEYRGKFLTKLRLEKNLKQNDLAKMIGYSEKSISKWERGKCFPKNTETLIKLADIFNVSIDELLQGEYSDIEGKNTPRLKNKYLNFIFQKRIIFIIIFVLIILFNFGYYYLVIDFKSLNERTYLYSDEVQNIDENLFEDLEYENDSVIKNNKDDISNNKINFYRNKIDNVLINEGFIFENNFYTKYVNDSILIKYFLINDSLKIYFYINNNELIVLNNSKYYDEIVVEKYLDGKHEIEYIKNDEIKNCNIENCESYLDYAMYINYIKKLIFE